MKKIFFVLFAFALLLSVMPPPLLAAPDDPGTSIVLQSDLAPAAMAQETGGVELEQGDPVLNVDPESAGIKDFFAENWLVLSGGLLVFIELIVRLTPTKKDDSIVNWLNTLLGVFVPNFKKGGGTFVATTKVKE